MMSPAQEKMLQENSDMTKEIHSVLLGNPTFKVPGLVEDVHGLKRQVALHDRKLLKWGSAIIGAGSAVEIIKFVFHVT